MERWEKPRKRTRHMYVPEGRKNRAERRHPYNSGPPAASPHPVPDGDMGHMATLPYHDIPKELSGLAQLKKIRAQQEEKGDQ